MTGQVRKKDGRKTGRKKVKEGSIGKKEERK